MMTTIFQHVLYFVVVLIVINCVSCKENQTVENTERFTFIDDFENELQPFWDKEIADESRYSIVDDPLSPGNKVLKVHLKLEDMVANGRRAEFPLWPSDSLGFKTNYRFRFMLPEDFFHSDESEGQIIIHQFHDMPDPGFDWSNQHKVTHPPVYLSVKRDDNHVYTMLFRTGLETGGMNESVIAESKVPLIPNKWYVFSNEIYWHVYTNKAYAIPKLDDEYMFTEEVNGRKSHKIRRRNMYNSIPNYPKIGLYRQGGELHDRTIYFDDFYYETRRAGDFQ